VDDHLAIIEHLFDDGKVIIADDVMPQGFGDMGVRAWSSVDSAPGGHMRRGEIWWVEFDERRPVVLLSGEDPSGLRAMQVVAPAETDISGWGVEVAVGVQEGLPFDGVLRFAFPHPGLTPCTWLTTVSGDDLIERAGAVSAAKLREIDDALRRAHPGS
jgi:mRNA interferase MazF